MIARSLDLHLGHVISHLSILLTRAFAKRPPMLKASRSANRSRQRWEAADGPVCRHLFLGGSPFVPCKEESRLRIARDNLDKCLRLDTTVVLRIRTIATAPVAQPHRQLTQAEILGLVHRRLEGVQIDALAG